MASHTAALPPPRDRSGPYRVCFVCLGNICRSPMAEVVARARLAAAGLDGAVVVDSAGTGDWHVGARMDPGARAQLSRAGYDGGAHRARQFDPSWLADRDLILAMDKSNFKTLKSRTITNDGDSPRIRLFGDVAGLAGADIPDPYLDAAEFGTVLRMLESGLPTLITEIRKVL
jgi:protein-tyrosine phosphatase